jgi:hypothetical protein
MKWVAAGLLLAAVGVGTIADSPADWPKPEGSGLLAVAVDIHVHAFPLSWSPLAPWDLVLEAKRQRLDAIAIAGHNHVWAGQIGRWFSRLVGGPTVISSEEVHPPHGHIIALGIEQTVDWNQSSEAIIDDIHRQHGLAIAAHPVQSSWDRFPDAAIRKLDGSEVEQPITILQPQARREMQQFHQGAGGAALASSDYRGLGPIGLSRSYVLATENSQAAILEAIRAGRVLNFGFPAPAPGRMANVSAVCGLVGLLLIVLRPGWRRGSRPRRS